MVKRIVFFGDSWCYGSDLVDPVLLAEIEQDGMSVEDAEYRYFHKNKDYREYNRFSEIIGRELDCEVINLSEPGNSLIGMKVNFISWVKETKDFDNTVCIFALTETSRYSFYDNEEHKWHHSSWIQANNSHKYLNQWQLYLTKSHCRQLEEHILSDFLITTEGVCQQHNMHYVYAPVFELSKHPEEINFTLKQYMEIEERNGHDVWAWGEHPNELGHKFIAKHLISFMKERKIVT